MKKLTGMIAFLLLCALSNSAFAVPLYSNGGFVDTGDAYDITGDTVSNSFTLTGNTPVTGVSFYSYNTTGNPTSTVDWAITSAALSGTLELVHLNLMHWDLTYSRTPSVWGRYPSRAIPTGCNLPMQLPLPLPTLFIGTRTTALRQQSVLA